jgi:hypothetical protein
MTLLSTIVFRELKRGDGDAVSQGKELHAGQSTDGVQRRVNRKLGTFDASLWIVAASQLLQVVAE